MSVENSAKELYENVIKNDYCIGCGVCASQKNSPFKIRLNEYGNMVACKFSEFENCETDYLSLCPFSGKSKNEDEISEVIFSTVEHKNKSIGKYITNYAGYVQTGEFRDKGSSGGIGKWLGYTLLEENKIDYFIQVVGNTSNDPSQPLFDYQVFSDKEEVLIGSKSSYYPVSMVNIIELIRKTEGRYAITGVPCFIKSLRLLAFKEQVIADSVKYAIGIVCGGMKSANQSKLISWQLGVHPNNLVAIDFRRKSIAKPASIKIYEVWSNLDKVERHKESHKIVGTDWSGSFRPKVCDYCDDVVAETADISIGDAWLPNYIADPKGTNIVIVRNPEIQEILMRYATGGELKLDEISSEDIAISQAGGFRQRREALSFRIEKKEKLNEWYPAKRVKPSDYKISRKRKRIYGLREEISKLSEQYGLEALKNNDVNIFLEKMKPVQHKYFVANHGTLPVRLFKKIKGKVIRMLNRSKILY